MSKVKNPKLAKQGKISYEWARTHMDILDNRLKYNRTEILDIELNKNYKKTLSIN